MNADSTPNDPPKKKSDKTVRIVVFGLLGILAIYAVLKKMDDMTINQGVATHDAWLTATEKAEVERTDLFHSELARYIQGQPKIEIDENPNRSGAVSVETYTWNGTFSTYTVQLELGLPASDPAVNRIIEIRQK